VPEPQHKIVAESTRIDDDSYVWLLEQAALLKAQRFSMLDWKNLAEELEAMAASQRSELKSRLHVLLLHLLKWQTQPSEREYRGRSWRQSIREARRRITDLMKESPSLKHYLPDLLAEAWEWAYEDAKDDAPEYDFPIVCPWTYEVFMERTFLPTDSSTPTV
jgi:hypothetical protein